MASISGRIDPSKSGIKPAASIEISANLIAFGTSTVVFGLVGAVGLYLTQEVGRVALFWPANAIVICLALSVFHRQRWACVAGAFLGNVVLQKAMGDPALVGLGFAFANLVEIGVTIALLEALGLRRGSMKDVWSTVAAIGTIVAAGLPSSLIGSIAMMHGLGQPIWPSMARWWVSDIPSAMIVLLPFLSAARDHVAVEWLRRATRQKVVEIGFVAVASVAQLALITAVDLPLHLALLLPILWIAIRLGVFWTAMTVSVLVLAASLLAVFGYWPLIQRGDSLTDNVLMLQFTLIFTGLTPILVAASVTALNATGRILAHSEQRARNKNLELETTLATMNQGLAMFDAEGRLVLWNQRYADIFGLKPSLLRKGTSLIDILLDRQFADGEGVLPHAVVEAQMAELAKGNTVRSTYRLINGRVVSTIASPMDGGGWVSTHEDITEREDAAARVAYAAHHDVLTGLSNRFELRRRINLAITASTEADHGLSLFVIDLDRFKSVNDTFGHVVGDRILVSVADRLSATVRQKDVVARLGGDQFAILCNLGNREREEASGVAARLLDAIGAPYLIDGNTIEIGLSIGVALAPDHGSDADSLLRNADAALYKVKANGRNSFRFFDSDLEAEVARRRALEADLREALKRNEFELHYQFILRPTDRRIVSAEALVRWRHPVLGLIPPDQFIPMAEDSGLIVPLGEWVIRQACLEATFWPQDIKVAVNVSAGQLGRTDLVGVVTRALTSSGLPARRFELEVTESIFLRNDEALLSDLHQLHGLGITLALDDFGTGYSALGYLRRLPFGKIKIDKSFIDDISTDRHSAAVVCAVANLAHSLDIETVAEGIEDDDQIRLVTAAGCSLVQGFLLHRPQPLHQLNFGIDGNVPATAAVA